MPGMEAGSIYATAELDVSKFTSGAAQLDGEAAKIAASMEKAAAGLNVAQANLNDLAAGLEQARARMDAAEATFNRSTATLEEMQIKQVLTFHAKCTIDEILRLFYNIWEKADFNIVRDTMKANTSA